MNRWSAGGIALSSMTSRYQHGSVFRAGGADGAPANAAAAYGRCAAAMTSAVAWSTSAAKASRNASGLAGDRRLGRQADGLGILGHTPECPPGRVRLPGYGLVGD